MSLAFALIGASAAPLLLLDGTFKVIAASDSFRDAFRSGPDAPVGQLVFEMGGGEWNLPRLRSLLSATASGNAEIKAYEMDLESERQGVRKLVLNAHKLSYGGAQDARLVLTVMDVTDVRAAAKLQDDLLREKAILLQEVQHRVANSLQIISSVILQSAMRTQSEEARTHLKDVNSRVLSVAEMQRQLAVTSLRDVDIRAYFTQLCLSLGASMIRDHDQLTIEVEAEDDAVNPDVSVSLGLIVTELVINALKHAFPDGRAGKIIVGYRSHGPNWTLSVSDNGVGMPKDPAGRRPGLGTSIVEALARQLRADVRVADAVSGTAVSIVHTQIAAVDDSGKRRPPLRAV